MEGTFFGLTEGTVTTVGIITGMYASTSMRKAIIGAVLAATISDSFGDGIGLYYAEQANPDPNVNPLHIVLSMIGFKNLVSLSYLIPLLLINDLKNAVIVSLIMAAIVICLSLTYLAKLRKEPEIRQFIVKNAAVMLLAIIASYLAGNLLDKYWG